MQLAKQVSKLEGLLKGVRGQLSDKTSALEQVSERAAKAEKVLGETQQECHAVNEQL